MKFASIRTVLLTTVPALALGLGTAHAQYQQNQPPPPQYQDRDHDRGGDSGRHDWDAPPQNFDDMRRRAYHDGLDAAQNDAQNSRRMDFDDSMYYRRPPVPRAYASQYRTAFVQGYQAARQRMQWQQSHPGNNWDHDHDRWNNQYWPR